MNLQKSCSSASLVLKIPTLAKKISMDRKFVRLLIATIFAFGIAGCKTKKEASSGQKAENIAESTSDSGEIIERGKENGEIDSLIFEDACRIVLRNMESRTAAKSPTCYLVRKEIGLYYDAIVKARALSRENDDVPDITHIHTFPNPNMRTIMVVLKKGKFIEGEGKPEKTGFYDLDFVLKNYDLVIKDVKSMSIGQMIQVETPKFLNTRALARQIAEVEVVEFAEPEGAAGGGNDIKTGPGGKNRIAIRFIEGWGDCPSGCIHKRIYTFYYGPKGEIEYIGVEGDEKPDNEGRED